MISNIVLFIGGACVGVMIMSVCSINTINEEKQKAYQRGLERGRREGRKNSRNQ